MSDGHRRAALALHGLATADREWMLAQLASPDRAALENLLVELRELGFPAGSAAIEANGPQPPIQAMPPTACDLVRDASVAHIAEALAAEPARVVARILAIQPWPWADDFMKRLDRARRRAVRDEMPRQSGGERLSEALVDALAARIVSCAKPAQTTRLSRFRPRLPWRKAA